MTDLPLWKLLFLKRTGVNRQVKGPKPACRSPSGFDRFRIKRIAIDGGFSASSEVSPRSWAIYCWMPHDLPQYSFKSNCRRACGKTRTVYGQRKKTLINIDI